VPFFGILRIPIILLWPPWEEKEAVEDIVNQDGNGEERRVLEYLTLYQENIKSTNFESDKTISAIKLLKRSSERSPRILEKSFYVGQPNRGFIM
jgi:hypothetical protein